MKNQYFPKGLPDHIAKRLDGILDDLDDRTREQLRKDLSVEDLSVADVIEELVEDIETWEEGNNLGAIDGKSPAFGNISEAVDCQVGVAQQIIYDLRAIELLSQHAMAFN